MSTRRQRLGTVRPTETTNAGLWLDKYVSEQAKTDEKSRKNLVDEVAGLSEPQDYANLYEQWKTSLASIGAEVREASVQGRMAIGLGEESVLETSISLHHTYGVPYIPGSALKGLAASFAHQKLEPENWQARSRAYKILFGDTDNAGYVVFFDALLVPGSGYGGQAVRPDVIAVHHRDYYRQAESPPADWDSPIPVPFLSATGRYLIALAGPTEWVTAAYDILALALFEAGVGARTSSGYGRLMLQPSATSAQSGEGQLQTVTPVLADPEQSIVDGLLRELEVLAHHRVAGEIARFVDRWRGLEAREELRQQLARAILDKMRGAGREKASAKKAWYQELLSSLQDDSIDEGK